MNQKTNKRQTKRKKIFQNSIHRLVKLTLAAHKDRAFLRAPHRTRQQKRYIYANISLTLSDEK